MRKQIESRSTEIDTEKCIEKSGVGRYEMILMASQRLRELKQKNRDQFVTSIDALKELQQGQIQAEDYLVTKK